jgi:cystathionine beta-lyase/cystathionine gamma-synthase
MKSSFKLATLAIHAGQDPDPLTGSVTVPIYSTSTYAQEGIGRHKGFEYSRTQNPTRFAWEESIAALEGADDALAFASGVAATDAVLRLLSAGDHVVAAVDMYGGTFRLFDKVLRRFGLDFSFVDMTDASAIERAIGPKTKMIFTETPTNPMMMLTDLRAVSAIAKARGVLSVVDNTFASPALQNPIALGCDVVVHSATKYLGGHSDIIGGVVCARDAAVVEQLKFIQNAAGAIPSPFDCWLLLRSVKTLPIRMEAHCNNAERLAAALAADKRATRVIYPGLPSHPQHELAKRQMRRFGGMISMELGSLERARSFASRVRVFTLGESLGGVESLLCHPVTMTHGSVPPDQRARLGITDGLLRLSVGIEDVDDLLADVDQALG